MLSSIFDSIRRYKKQKAVAPAIPVISVGNITLGGSGKTPLVYYLAEKLQPLYSKIAILTRGYRKIKDNSFGKSLNMQDDEDFTYRYTNIIRVVNKNRVQGIQKAIGYGAELAILDDGFQYHNIEKNIDILVINPFQKIFSSFIFPFGILRESINSISYADIIVINYYEFLSKEEKENILAQLSKYHKQKTYNMQYKISYLVNTNTNEKIDIESFSNKKVVIFSGIGYPKGFSLLLQKYNIEISKIYNFPDHHSFSANDIKKITTYISYPIITTEKDILRIPKNVIHQIPNLFYTVLGITIENDFIAFIRKSLKDCHP